MMQGLHSEIKEQLFLSRPITILNIDPYLVKTLAWADVVTVGDVMQKTDVKLIRLIGLNGTLEVDAALLSLGHERQRVSPPKLVPIRANCSFMIVPSKRTWSRVRKKVG